MNFEEKVLQLLQESIEKMDEKTKTKFAELNENSIYLQAGWYSRDDIANFLNLMDIRNVTKGELQ